LQFFFDPTFSVIEVLSGEGTVSKQEVPSVRPGHGMDRDNHKMIHSVERTDTRLIDLG
jgi:hypothetical protein